MKHLIAFFLILASSLSSSFACGPYYPYGEDVRFSILNPSLFGFDDYSSFYYSSTAFFPSDFESINSKKGEILIGGSQKLNIKLWLERCNNCATELEVYKAVYVYDENFNTSNTPNKFLQFLENKDTNAKEYLQFAKKCSKFNAFFTDPWERRANPKLETKNELINFALSKIEELDDEKLKSRYAFISMRLAYYSNNYQQIKTIYNKLFLNKENKNIIDYWSLYFRAIIEPKGALKNYYSSQVFANAPDKRFVINSRYDKSVPISETLKFAKTNKERANVWLLAGIRNHAKALESIKQMYKLNSKSEGLSFLLLREINKLEDWIFTPYYTKLYPSIYSENKYNTEKNSLNAISKDMLYANKLLHFVSNINQQKTDNKLLWEISKAYLLYMTKKYSSATAEINKLLKKDKNNKELSLFLQKIKALSLISNQETGKAIISKEVKQALLNDKGTSSKFIFAIARELEYKGNTTDAAILLSKINTANDYWWENGSIFWRTKKRHKTLYGDFYNDYFFYLDAQYTPTQLEALITAIEENKMDNNFDTWKYSLIQKDLPRLSDLLGTKYIRKNQLHNALQAFTKVEDSLWTSKHYPYKTYLNANPFYTNMYNEHKPTKADTIKYNKESITRTLITYLEKANNPKNKKRDYYYFLVANCYLNMSHHGNSWMMKRYYWTTWTKETKLEDDSDFINADLAKKFYLKAKAVSKSTKFSALCLRMAGRCEKYSLLNKLEEQNIWYSSSKQDSMLFQQNKYYKQLDKEYPDYYDDLISNCEVFEEYFEARK